MGGEILEYEAKTIYRRGKEEGREEGINALLSNLIKSGKISEDDAKELGDKAKVELRK